MSGRKLDASYAAYKMQVAAHGYARQAASRSTVTPELLQQLGLDDLVGEPAKNRHKKILEWFEAAGRQLRRQCFIDLVASFEADLFKLIGSATNRARHVLKQHYENQYSFCDNPGELVRTASDFSNLSGYRRLLSHTKTSDHDPRRALWNVIAQRDFLAHGERWEPLAIPPTIDPAYLVLSRELDRIS